MSQGNQSCLRFSLEESVWFQKGQEVAELVSISLDPNVTIQENDQYVTIHGSLQLTGEYNLPEEEVEEESVSFSAPKFIQSVSVREEGRCEFFHAFPVDITIPNNRIKSVDDVDVTVESFDYLFPERNCMRLSADLAITGLYADESDYASQGDIEPEDSSFLTNVELVGGKEEYPGFVVYGGEAREEIDINEHDQVFSAEARMQPEEMNEEKLYEFEEDEKESEFGEGEKMVVFTPDVFFEDVRSEPNVPAKEPEVAEVKVETAKYEPDDESPQEMVESPEGAIEEESESSSEDHHTKKKKASKKKSLTLTEFFARKEETGVAQLRVCIVQQGDTLGLIAERYEIPVQQLMRVNQLEANEDVSAGQVLYVPGAAQATS